MVVRSVLVALLGLSALAAPVPAFAQNWQSFVFVSETLGVSASRLCSGAPMGEKASDIGCPSYAPSLTTAGDVSVTGNLSASKFIGDGSGLTGVGSSADSISSTNTTARVYTTAGGTVSLTTGSVAGTSYFDTTGRWIGPGISITTGNGISSTSGYFSGKVGIGTKSPAMEGLHISGTSNPGMRVQASNAWDIFTSASGGRLAIYNTTGSAELMTFRTSGNVGIGTTAPSQALEVSGSVRIAESGSSTDTCSGGAKVGTVRIDPITNAMMVCR